MLAVVRFSKVERPQRVSAPRRYNETIYGYPSRPDTSTSKAPCAVSFVFPDPADFTENRYFTVEAAALLLFLGVAFVSIDDMEMSGLFASDLSQFEGGTLAGSFDATSLDGIMGGDTCDLLTTFNVSCEEYDDGTGPHCLTVYVDNIVGPVVPGLDVVTITQDDVDNNPSCAVTTP